MYHSFKIIICAFYLSFALMVLLSAFALKQFNYLANHSEKIDHANKIIKHLLELETTLNEVDIRERGFFITQDSSFYRQMIAFQASLFPKTDSLKTLLANNPAQRQHLRALQLLLLNRIQLSKRLAENPSSNRLTDQKNITYHSRQLRTAIRQLLNNMQQAEIANLATGTASRKYSEQFTLKTLLSILICFGLATIILFLLMMREFAKRTLFQERLQQQHTILCQSHAELEQVAYATSHNLREPVRKITMFTSRILRRPDALNDDAKDAIIRIHRAASHTQALIANLNTLAKLLPTDQPSPVNLFDAWRLAKLDLQDAISTKNATFLEDPLPTIDGYPTQLQILFRSLIDNALKFAQPAQPPHIQVTCTLVANNALPNILQPSKRIKYYQIAIQDNGIGFDNQFINKIFQIFQRLQSPIPDDGSQGIGLAICQRIMANHAGAIVANGVPNVGATFFLFFPKKFRQLTHSPHRPH